LLLGFERSDLIRIDTNHEVVDVIVGFVANGAPITAVRTNKLDEGKDGPIDLPSS
jgi:orotate phosphoribosyltransferase-like protein